MNEYVDETKTWDRASEFSLAKVFGWMGLGLLLTFGVAIGLAYLLPVVITNPDINLGVMIGALVLMIVETFVLSHRVAKNNKSATVPFIIYSASMGVVISSIILYTEARIVLLSLGTTALVFGLLALFGFLSKKDLSRMGSVAAMTVIGAIIISVVNVIFFRNETMYWVISLVTFGAFMLFTAVDMWRVRKIIESGAGTRNIAIYCAFQLYLDFIYIFIRIVQIFAMNSNN